MIKQSILIDEKFEYNSYVHDYFTFLSNLSSKEKSDWWYKQKFKNKDLRGTYKFIEFPAFKKLMKNIQEKRILDLACGPGFFSNYCTRLNAKVIGIDINNYYIEIARKKAQSMKLNTKFIIGDMSKKNTYQRFNNNYFDIIFIIDTVCTLYRKNIDMSKMLDEIYRILKPEGFFYIIDPHPVFSFVSGFGNESHPFTIISEYKRTYTKFTPTLQEISTKLEKARLRIHQIIEPIPSKELEKHNKPLYYFRDCFPDWIIYKIVKSP